MVVAQLEEWSVPTPEVHSLNPVIFKTYTRHLFTVNCIEKTKIDKKRPGMAYLKNIFSLKRANLFPISASRRRQRREVSATASSRRQLDDLEPVQSDPRQAGK